MARFCCTVSTAVAAPGSSSEPPSGRPIPQEASIRQDNYCIRADYSARSQNATIEESVGDYWNEYRIAMAETYQFYVYRLACEVAAKMLLRPITVADVGCGYPAKLALLEAMVDSITLIDQATLGPMLAERFDRCRFVPMDLEKPGPIASSYDLVICSDVLEHLLDPDPCVRFIAGIGSPNARFVFSTPERDVLRGPECLASPKEEHVREWNREEFLNYLRSHGFTIEKSVLMPPRRLPDGEFQQYVQAAEPVAGLHCCHAVVASRPPAAG